MYATHDQTIEAAHRWLNMAIAYQTMAVKRSTALPITSGYTDVVFACCRGYDRCIQMYFACWSHIDAMDKAYFRKKDYEEKQIEIQRKKADEEAKKDWRFIRVMLYLVSALIGVLFADVWISFIEWLAPHLI